MKWYKKIISVVLICLALLIIMAISLFKSWFVDEIDYKALVYTYQLPNKLFVDHIDKNDVVDVFSTTSMKKIKSIVYNNSSNIDTSRLNLSCNNMDELYFLRDTFIALSDSQRDKYKSYIESTIQQDGLVSYLEQEDVSVRLVYTLYVVTFAQQYNIEITQFEETKLNIEERVKGLKQDDSLFYVSSVVQLAKAFNINLESSYLTHYYKDKCSYMEDAMLNGAGDLMDMYYLSIIKNAVGINDTISKELQTNIASYLYYSYSTLSLFYDAIYILNEYSVMNEYKDIISECIKKLDDRYLIEDELYCCISTETPSLLATYCALYLFEKNNVDSSEDKEVVEEYLKGCILDETYMNFTSEELLYFEEIMLLVNYDYAQQEKFKDAIQKRMTDILEENTTLSIRDIYCMQEICSRLNQDSAELMSEKYKGVLSTYENKDLSVANYAMLMITLKNLGDNVSDIMNIVEQLENELTTIMDVYYYIQLCNEFDIQPNEEKVHIAIRSLRNEKGYYISSEQKVNTLFTLYLGYNIEKYLD